MNRRQRRQFRRNGHRRVDVVAVAHASCCARRPPVGSLTETQLRTELVQDAVKGHATDLARFVEACERIGKLSGRGAEAAYTDIVGEVRALTGRGLPQGL